MKIIKLTIEVEENLHTKLKMESAKKKISMKDLITPALESLVK